ncbi:MAG: alpha/beta hydrolase [Rhodanobacteraceae bacterium]
MAPAIAEAPGGANSTLTQPQLIRVDLGSDQTQPVSGRLLIFAIPEAEAEKQAHDGKVTYVGTNPFKPNQVAVAAQEVHHLVPGHSVIADADVMAFPKKFSQLAPGSYDVQVVLDVNHDNNYGGRDACDVVSAVTTINLGDSGAIPDVTLTRTLKASPIWSVSDRLQSPPGTAKALALAHKHTDDVDFVSPALTAFWGRPIHMRGFVVKPPGYAAHPYRHYPVVYWNHGFGGPPALMTYTAAKIYGLMDSGKLPRMIWVLLDYTTPTGTTEFANSVNNGPWGTALTEELIPHLESMYRMDGDANGRFLLGHSSGGWAALWLETRYPKMFGGAWSAAPDPVDFHDFVGVDLYAPQANVYHTSDGTPRPLMRFHGKVIATFEQSAKLERVMGPYGGQLASFEWVFSPRGKDGRPEQMFNRDTGAVNPKVVTYWRDHYDIAYRLRAHWSQLKPYLDGKLHIFVGTADNFYLAGSVHKLESVLDSLHAKTDIHFLPGKTHFADLYTKGKDKNWLLEQMVWQMYHVARPNAELPKRVGSVPVK